MGKGKRKQARSAASSTSLLGVLADGGCQCEGIIDDALTVTRTITDRGTLSLSEVIENIGNDLEVQVNDVFGLRENKITLDIPNARVPGKHY